MNIEKFLVGFGLCVALILGTTVYLLVKNKNPFFSGFVSGFVSGLLHEKQLNDDSPHDWKNYSYPDQKCSIDSPLPLEPIDEGYTKESKAQIDHSMVVFAKNKSQDFFLFCSCLDLKKGKMDLDGVQNATLRNIENVKNHSNFKFLSKPTTWFGNSALYAEGAFNLFSVLHRKFKLLTVVKGPCNWQVQVQYMDGNPKAEEGADRVIKSFKILK